MWCYTAADHSVKWIRLFPLCDFAFVNKLGHCFISEQIGKLYLSWLSPLPCGPYVPSVFLYHFYLPSCSW